MRQGITERVHQLEKQIESKLDQARERRELIEREQKEKLRNHVSPPLLTHSLYIPKRSRRNAVAHCIHRESIDIVSRFIISRLRRDRFSSV